MSKLKQSFIIVCFFCLLIGVAAMPLFIMDYNNNLLINKITVDSLAPELSISPNTSQGYNIRERIKTVKGSVVVGTNEQPLDSSLNETKGDVISNMEVQLRTLQELGVLPQLTFTDNYQADVSKKTYIDTQNPNNSLSVWEIRAEYPDFHINTFMDTETSLLYDITLISRKKGILYDSGHISKDGFLKYLKIDSEYVNEQGEIFDVRGYYSEHLVSLFVISYNESMEDITTYSFDNYRTNNYELIEEYKDPSVDQEMKFLIVP